MVTINQAILYEYVSLSEQAKISSIKSLDQGEREILQRIFSAVQRVESYVQMEQADAARLVAIKEKLQTPQSLPPTSSIMRVIKAVLNFFGWRISSEALIQQAHLAEAVQRRNSVARDQAIDNFEEEFAPQIIERSSTFLRENPTILSQDLKPLFESAEAMSTEPPEFILDYMRGGFFLQIVDGDKPPFIGRPTCSSKESVQDRYQFHLKGISQFFSEEEVLWKRCIQASVTQSLVNAVSMPMSHITLDSVGPGVPWGKKHRDALGRELTICYAAALGEKNIRVEIQRDTSQKITASIISLHLEVPVLLYSHDQEPNPSDVIGHFSSDLNYKLALGPEGEPVLSDIACGHRFTRKT